MSLHEIQTAVHVAKDKRNEFGNYNYRTAEGILAALKAALPEGATIIVSDSLQELAGQIFVTATATIALADGVKHSATGHALHPLQKKGMDPSQITGAASSYARKYALAGLLALDDGSVDPDAKDNRRAMEEGQEEARAQAAVKASVEAIFSLTQATTLDALQAAWQSLTPSQRNDKSVANTKDDMKATLKLEADLDDKIPDFASDIGPNEGLG